MHDLQFVDQKHDDLMAIRNTMSIMTAIILSGMKDVALPNELPAKATEAELQEFDEKVKRHVRAANRIAATILTLD